MTERAEKQLQVHFPNVPEQWLWHRKRNDGFTTIPRSLPIVMEAIDSLSKGQPAGHVLFSLWCRAPDHPLLTIENPGIFASEAGFTGGRALDTWRRRMKVLRELGFIQTKDGASGDFHYVLLMNPNTMLEWLRLTGRPIQSATYAKFHDRLLEIGSFKELEMVRQYHIQSVAQQLAVAAAPAIPDGSSQAQETEEATVNAKLDASPQ